MVAPPVAMETESGIGEYKKLQLKQFPPRSQRETAEGKFWRSYKSPQASQQVGAVTSVHFCEAYPHNFAITSSTRVIIYDSQKRVVKRSISRFRDIAYSGSFRSDGQLLVAGGESGIVQVFDVNSRTVLRQLKGHTRAVHFTRYSKDKLHVLSTGDDKSVRWWDVAAQACLSRFDEHTDYVRCGAPSPANSSLWASGSYDHTVKLWDTRSSKSVMNIKLNQPLESLQFFPSGSLLATAAGSQVCIWDVLSGGKLVEQLSNHQKTVTALSLAPPMTVGPANRSPAPRLLTGSLDCHVKVYDMDSFKVNHASVYPDPVLCLGMSGDGVTLAVGLSSGLLVTRQRKTRSAESVQKVGWDPRLPGVKARKRPVRVPKLTPAHFRYFTRGKSEKAAAEDFLVAQRKRAHLAPHDRLLRKFRFGEALTAALRNGSPEVVVAVLEELVALGGLRTAIAGMPDGTLEPLLAFLVKYTTNPRHSALLVPLTNLVLDLYAGGFCYSSAIDHQVKRLREELLLEARLQESLLGLRGILQPLLHAASTIG